MGWRIGLVDSCGSEPGAVAAVRFEWRDGQVQAADVGPDRSGHGTRIAQVIGGGRADVEFALAQVLDASGRTSAGCVAAGIDWCLRESVDLVHLSLGLSEDRVILRDAIDRALAQGCIVVASVPARGAVPFPAAYPGVLRATGDARCSPDQVSNLAKDTFGGCPATPGGGGGGASVGAAHVTRILTIAAPPCDRATAIVTLSDRASWVGPERRGGGAPGP